MSCTWWRPATGTVDRVIVEVAKANPTDGTRMVAALAGREIDRPPVSLSSTVTVAFRGA